MRAPLDRVGLPVGEVSRRGVGCRKDRGIRLWRDRGQEEREPLASLPNVAAELPEAPDGGRDTDTQHRIAVIARPAQGRSNITINFNLEKDPDLATQEVRDKVSTIINRLPQTADPPVVRKADPDSQPVLRRGSATWRPCRRSLHMA